jgi:hypothetical protein
LALKDWSTLRMSENYGGCDAGTAGQRFALPLQISDVGVAVSHTNVNGLFTPARIFR